MALGIMPTIGETSSPQPGLIGRPPRVRGVWLRFAIECAMRPGQILPLRIRSSVNKGTQQIVTGTAMRAKMIGGDVVDRADERLVQEPQVVGQVPRTPHDSDDEPDCRVGQPPTQEPGSEVAAPSALLRDVFEHGRQDVHGDGAPEGPQPAGAEHPRRPTDGDGDDEGQREDADRHPVGPQPARQPRNGVGAAQRRVAQSQDRTDQQRRHDPYERSLSLHGVGGAQGVVDEEPDPARAEDDDTENDETGQGAYGGCTAGGRCFIHTHTMQYEYWTMQVCNVDASPQWLPSSAVSVASVARDRVVPASAAMVRRVWATHSSWVFVPSIP